MRYKELVPFSATNIQSIVHNQMLSQVSSSMQLLVDVGQKIDSLNMMKNELDRQINLEKRAIKQLHTSVISYSSEIRKLVIQNCQFSKNKNCQGTLYNSVTNDIRLIYIDKKHLANEFLKVAKYDAQVSREMEEITKGVQETLETNSNFISLFQERRLGGISFKLKKSIFETDQLIRDSQKSLRRLTSEISKLKNELRKMKSM